eukprot:scaffold98645_cov31-Phaeocystis_antarctica.AAC.1
MRKGGRRHHTLDAAPTPLMGAGQRMRSSEVRRAAQARSLVPQAACVDQPPRPRSFQPAASATAVASSILARNCSEGAERCRGVCRAMPSGVEACSARAVRVQRGGAERCRGGGGG